MEVASVIARRQLFAVARRPMSTLRVPLRATTRTLSSPSLLRYAKPRPLVTYHQSNAVGRVPQRHNSSLTTSSPESSEPPQDLRPAYQLTFTCKPCGARSSHRVTKQGYHKGTVLITCPDCKNKHVITDHLKVFMDQASSFEDILKRKLPSGRPLSDLLKKGQLGIRNGSKVGNEGEEDVEFWEDGTEIPHQKPET